MKSEKVKRLIAAYYDAMDRREKKRAKVIYKMLWDLGVVL